MVDQHLSFGRFRFLTKKIFIGAENKFGAKMFDENYAFWAPNYFLE